MNRKSKIPLPRQRVRRLIDVARQRQVGAEVDAGLAAVEHDLHRHRAHLGRVERQLRLLQAVAHLDNVTQQFAFVAGDEAPQKSEIPIDCSEVRKLALEELMRRGEKA